MLIFDDFEWNLEHRQGRYILKTQVAEVFKALVWAIEEIYTKDRIIITCRYDFESDLDESFYKQPLESFRKSDLQKKLRRLKAFNSESTALNLIEQAKTLADGNPRLLEWLNDEVLLGEDAEIKLTQLEANPSEWKGKTIWEEFYNQIGQAIGQIPSRCLVFEIPVPISALEAVCESISDYKKQLSRAIELGLIEVSPEADESKQVYRVSRILPHIIPTIRLPEASEVYSIYQKAYEKLHQLWGNKENKSDEKWREIFRLKFANKENPERFRQGFYQMLEVQFNTEADEAFEFELKKVVGDLVEDGLCTQLENYLQQQQWREADEETAWIFFQVMVKENYEDWGELIYNFPCETLREINSLWVHNSNNKFGISIQAEICRSLSPNCDNVWDFCDEWRVRSFDDHNWDIFGTRIRYWNGNLVNYDELMKKLEKNLVKSDVPSSSLPPLPPVLIYKRRGGWRNLMVEGGWKSNGVSEYRLFFSLAQKLGEFNL